MDRTFAPRRALLGALVALVACVSLVAAACGDDDESGGGDESTTTEAMDDATSTTEAAEAVEVRAIDYGFEDLPATIDAGSMVQLHNDSDVELHEFVAFKLPDSETRSAAELSKLPESELGALFAGEPAAVIIAMPGEDGQAVVGDGSISEPGRYVAFCAIPQGADPQEYMTAAQTSDGPPQVEGGPPHFVLGMVGDFTVQ